MSGFFSIKHIARSKKRKRSAKFTSFRRNKFGFFLTKIDETFKKFTPGYWEDPKTVKYLNASMERKKTKR